MPERGRPPVLHGRKAKEGGRLFNVPLVQMSEIETPEGLSASAAEAWDKMVRSLTETRVLSIGDLLALEAAARAWGRWRDFERQISALASGGNPLAGEVSKTPNGHLQISALRISANQAMRDYLAIAREFGLTPVARVKSAGQTQGDLFN